VQVVPQGRRQVTSAQTGKRLAWDAETMRFTNDARANQSVTPEYRAGWALQGGPIGRQPLTGEPKWKEGPISLKETRKYEDKMATDCGRRVCLRVVFRATVQRQSSG